MRETIFGLLAVSGVGAGVYYFPTGETPAGVYPLTPAEAVKRLSEFPTKTGTVPFYNLDITPVTAGNDYVKFLAEDGREMCIVHIVPVDGGVKVDPSCNGEDGPPDPSNAMGSTTVNLQQAGINEFVDAALDGRKFNKAGMNAKTIGTVMEAMPAMQKQALDSQRMMEAAERDLERRQDLPASDFGDGDFAGEPTDDYYD